MVGANVGGKSGIHRRFTIETGDITNLNHTLLLHYAQTTPQVVYMEYFEFLTSAGVLQTPIGGTVSIQTSQNVNFGYHQLENNGSFNAADAAVVTRARPWGVAIVDRFRVVIDSLSVNSTPYRVRGLVILYPV